MRSIARCSLNEPPRGTSLFYLFYLFMHAVVLKEEHGLHPDKLTFRHHAKRLFRQQLGTDVCREVDPSLGRN